MHPGTVLTDADIALVESSLETFARVGITLYDDIEAEDVEDAVADDLATFRSYPLTTVAGLHDPDGAPFLNGAVVSSVEVEVGSGPASGPGALSAEDIVAMVERFAGAAGSEATDVAVMPDPETDGATGSVRVRFGEWDVTDINYDFLPADGDDADAGSDGASNGSASRAFELDLSLIHI